MPADLDLHCFQNRVYSFEKVMRSSHSVLIWVSVNLTEQYLYQYGLIVIEKSVDLDQMASSEAS